MQSIDNKIERSVFARHRGFVFYRSNFAHLGSDTAIRQSLSRLEKKGVLIRLAQGLYLYPKKHKTLGVIYPTLEELAEAIAKRDKLRIIPNGQQALNQLGLSNQVPVNAVYLIDGPSRSVKIGNGTIKFKKVSPKILAVKNKINLLVIQAMKELGAAGLDDRVMSRIKEILEGVELSRIKKDMTLAPVWIAKKVDEILNDR